MDIKSPAARSSNMSRIRSAKTKPEVFIRSLLHRSGFRYFTNAKKVFGSPDIYFPKKHVAIFIHGCFWHRHKACKYAYQPKSNEVFWAKKFSANEKRDIDVINTLKSLNIRVLIIWECTVRKMKSDQKTCAEMLNIISEFINSNSKMYMEI